MTNNEDSDKLDKWMVLSDEQLDALVPDSVLEKAEERDARMNRGSGEDFPVAMTTLRRRVRFTVAFPLLDKEDLETLIRLDTCVWGIPLGVYAIQSGAADDADLTKQVDRKIERAERDFLELSEKVRMWFFEDGKLSAAQIAWIKANLFQVKFLE
jgi:hypothetical protein